RRRSRGALGATRDMDAAAIATVGGERRKTTGIGARVDAARGAAGPARAGIDAQDGIVVADDQPALPRAIEQGLIARADIDAAPGREPQLRRAGFRPKHCQTSELACFEPADGLADTDGSGQAA